MEEIASKPELSAGDLETLDKLTDTIRLRCLRAVTASGERKPNTGDTIRATAISGSLEPWRPSLRTFWRSAKRPGSGMRFVIVSTG